MCCSSFVVALGFVVPRGFVLSLPLLSPRLLRLCDKWCWIFDPAGWRVVGAGAFVPRGRGGTDRGARGRGLGAAPGPRGGAGGAFPFSRGGFRGARNVAFQGSAGRGSYRGGGGFSRGASGGGRAAEGNAEDDFPSLPSALAAA
jgi:hypothetical protein